MSKQKLVVKLNMHDAKSRSKAMKIAVGVPGVISASIEGPDRNQIVVVGEGVDSVDLTKQLRKRMGPSELVSLAAVDEKKKEEEKKPEKKVEEKKPEIPGFAAWPCQCHPGPQYVCYDPYPRNDGCSIM